MPLLTTSPKARLSEFFRRRLDTDDLHWFQNDADEDSQPPYGVITITEMRETTPRSNVFRAEIKIALITDIDDTKATDHDALLAAVLEKLDGIPRRMVDSETNIRLFGFTITTQEAISKEESQSFSDVITILAGCGG